MSHLNTPQTTMASRRPANRSGPTAPRVGWGLALIVALAFLHSAQSQTTTTWTGAIDSTWGNAGNWSNGVPGTNVNIVFGASASNTAIGHVSDAVFRSLTHTGALDYSVGLTTGCYQLYSGNIMMDGTGGNGNLSLPFAGGVRLRGLAPVISNNSSGTFSAHSLWHVDNVTDKRWIHVATGVPEAIVAIQAFQKRYGYNDVDLLKTGPGTLTMTGVTTYNFLTSGSGVSGLTGKVTVAGGTLQITSGNEDSLGRFNAGDGPFADDVLTLDGGTLRVSTNSLTIDDANRGITLGADGGGFNVDAALTLTIGTGNVITGPGSLTKSGDGTLTLQAANTYAGTTTVEAGLLNVTGTLPDNGVADVLIASAGTAFGASHPRIARHVPGGFDFSDTDWGSSILGGNHATTAELLAGTAGQDRTVTMAWREATQADVTATGRGLISDVLNLEGTGPDSYVLQMSYNPLASYAYLAWLDGDNWVHAVEGNTGAAGSQAVAGYAGSWADFTAGLTGWTLDGVLGSYGFDAANSVAWAVLDHNSLFAVVPEPGTWLMLLSALAFGLLHRRRRRF